MKDALSDNPAELKKFKQLVSTLYKEDKPTFELILQRYLRNFELC